LSILSATLAAAVNALWFEDPSKDDANKPPPDLPKYQNLTRICQSEHEPEKLNEHFCQFLRNNIYGLDSVIIIIRDCIKYNLSCSSIFEEAYYNFLHEGPSSIHNFNNAKYLCPDVFQFISTTSSFHKSRANAYSMSKSAERSLEILKTTSSASSARESYTKEAKNALSTLIGDVEKAPLPATANFTKNCAVFSVHKPVLDKCSRMLENATTELSNEKGNAGLAIAARLTAEYVSVFCSFNHSKKVG
jgi:hypothetical protein